MAAIAARTIPELPAGVHHLHDVLTLDDVPRGRGIEVDLPSAAG